MVTHREEAQSFLDFILWLIWVSIVTLVLGGMTYLFVGGSTLFNGAITQPIVVYRTTSEGVVSITGSIVVPSTCQQLGLQNSGTEGIQELAFTFTRIKGCHKNGRSGIPETFFAEFDGDEHTTITATVEGIKRDILIK